MKDALDQIRVASPCPASWDRMEGDERTRHCSLCELNVYNFAEMTRDEIRELLLRSEGGRVCGRLYRRADGTMITRDCPTAVQRVRQRVSQWAGATMAALLSVATFTRCATNRTTSVLPEKSNVSIRKEPSPSVLQSMLTGVVVDETGAVLPGVTVIVRDEDQHELTTISDANGQFVISPLKEGPYRLELQLSGFASAVVKDVRMSQSEVVNAHAVMQIADGGTIGIIVTSESTMIEHSAAKTTLSRAVLDSFPF